MSSWWDRSGLPSAMAARPCPTASRRMVAGERSEQLKAAIKSLRIEFTEPVWLPERLSLEPSVDLDPAGHR
jgi:hypothetical protein